MKTKNLLLWVAAFVIVAGVVTAAGLLRARRPSEGALLFFPGLSEDKLASIEIVEKDKSVRLARSGEVWVVAAAGGTEKAAGGLAGLADSTTREQEPVEKPAPPADRDYPVDSAMMASVVEKLQTMKKDELVSQNPEKQGVFEVDSASGILVSVSDNTGRQLALFRIGKNGPGWSSHYVRRDGSNDVYLVRGSIKYAFAADPDRWRDKTVIRFSSGTVRTVTLAKETGEPIVLEKTTDSTGTAGWAMQSPVQQHADAAKVDEIVNTLARLTCMGWESNTSLSDDSMGLARPRLTARVELEGGGERVVQVGKKVGTESKYWVRTPAHEGLTFHVSSYTIEKLDKKASDLKAPDPEPAADKGNDTDA